MLYISIDKKYSEIWSVLTNNLPPSSVCKAQLFVLELDPFWPVLSTTQLYALELDPFWPVLSTAQLYVLELDPFYPVQCLQHNCMH